MTFRTFITTGICPRKRTRTDHVPYFDLYQGAAFIFNRDFRGDCING